VPGSGNQPKRELRDVSPEIQAQLVNVRPQDGGELCDNSNTQFAIFALWVGRRYGMPVERALAAVDAYFRQWQNPDGGWCYSIVPKLRPGLALSGMEQTLDDSPLSTAAMTCAGLLGLALNYGVSNETVLSTRLPGSLRPSRPGEVRATVDPNRDPVVKKGLMYLGSCIGQPVFDEQADHPAGPAAQRFLVSRGYYYLWSLERVSMVYGLNTIGNKDWYGWGADQLLPRQLANGSWAGKFCPAAADTCFALLFLKRANLAQDLTSLLKGKIGDPGSRVLKAGTSLSDLQKKNGGKPGVGPSSPGKHPEGPTPSPAPVSENAEVTKLVEELLQAGPGQQEKTVEKFRDARGVVYTEALAAAIPKLEKSIRGKAREALADRLTRMSSATLQEKLQDDNPEVRCAAAIACAQKEDKTHVPRLIELLEDEQPVVRRGALAALKNLSGKDFGPEAEASREERAKAIADWKAWWSKNK